MPRRLLSIVAMVCPVIAGAIACGASAPEPVAMGAVAPARPSRPPSAPVTSASAIAESVPHPVQDRCEPLQVRWPQIPAADLQRAIPTLVDADSGAMAHFYRKLARVMRGRADDHVRIAFYGDSNLTMDLLSGSMRRTLQQTFGDAGHGYVAMGRPWRHYFHRDVIHGLDQTAWLEYAISTRKVEDGCYGFGGIASESVQKNAKAWVRTAPEGSIIGRTASRLEVHYLLRPGFGRFAVWADGSKLAEVPTDAPRVGAGVQRFELPDAPHSIEFTTIDRRKVRLFGAALERSQPGIVVDSLGIGGVSAHALSQAHPVVTRQSLTHRRYDLVLFLLGTNTVNRSTQAQEMGRIIDAHRDALPGVSILLMSPPDHVLSFDDPRTDPATLLVRDQMREIARDSGTAFWDFWQAMGGEASMLEFQRRRWNQWDLYHLNEQGASHMAGRLVHALWSGFARWAGEHPDAGCSSD